MSFGFQIRNPNIEIRNKFEIQKLRNSKQRKMIRILSI
jgi:hypothetical protein